MGYVSGNFYRETGFFTLLMGVINKTPDEMERALGFHSGRLLQGWTLLLLKEALKPDDFQFAGYTINPDGMITVKTPSGIPVRMRIDDFMRASADPYTESLGGGYGMQKRRVTDDFKIVGSSRVAKIIPRMPFMPFMPMQEQFPRASGLPQWILVKPKLFVAAAVVRPGYSHKGGGVDTPLPRGHWVDPRHTANL